MNNTVKWLWLHQEVRLTSLKERKIYEHFGSIENIFGANLSDYTELDFLKPEDMNHLCCKDLEPCYKAEEYLQKLNTRVITIDSPLYPELLKKIPDPPLVLYCRGKFVDLNDRLAIAMVGTRKPTNYGRQTAYYLARELSLAGTVIVSGMALGIDAKSHEGALSGVSPTVAVIGCGIDIAYPKTNAPLMKKIMEKGMVISEYPPGTPPEKFRFPERNRIISGLCQGTLVVEADFKSGSLITAKTAREQDRDVFAVPGNINSTYSKGTNYLLKDGAFFVTCPEDITKCYHLDYPQLFLSMERDVVTAEEDNDSPESRILNAIGSGTVHTDTICSKSGLDIGTVNSTLLMMELTGKIIKMPGGYYSRTSGI